MKTFRLLSTLMLVCVLLVSFTACDNVSDADIQNNAQELLNANPDLSAVVVSVQDRVATLTGIVKDEATKSYAETTVTGVRNVQSVINQIEVVPPAPDYTELDTQINAGLADALKDHQTVSATVSDGVITLTGEVNENDLPTLMERLNALQPVEIVNNTNAPTN